VRRELPATTISCWGESEARKLIGTELEYSAEVFRWKDVLTKHPSAETKVVSAEQFHADNSGMGTNSSQVTFAQLGIRRKQATAVSIQHPETSIGGATTEIPGDNILVKDRDTIVFSVCNVYFEAKRVAPTPPDTNPRTEANEGPLQRKGRPKQDSTQFHCSPVTDAGARLVNNAS
jgi:hypothetical protein